MAILVGPLLLAGCGGATFSEEGGNGGRGASAGAGAVGGSGALGGTGGVAGSGGGVAGSGGTGGVAGSGGTGAVAGTGGVAGGGGTGAVAGTGGMAGTGGAPACGRSQDQLDFEVEPYDGERLGCTAARGTTQIVGQVIESTAKGFALESCPPMADCFAPMRTVVSLTQAPDDLFMDVPLFAYVQVDFEVAQPWACVHRIMVTNLAEWDGVPNPVVADPVLYLAASDGFLEAPEAAPFDVGSIALGCYPELPSCGEPADDYALLFSTAPGAPVAEVLMGETSSLSYQHSGFSEHWTIRNARSYVSGACDDHWNWAWWVQGSLVVPFGG